MIEYDLSQYYFNANKKSYILKIYLYCYTRQKFIISITQFVSCDRRLNQLVFNYRHFNNSCWRLYVTKFRENYSGSDSR